MYFVDNNTGVPTMPPMSPQQNNTVQWFTEGDHNKGISVIGQDYLNGFLAEHLNILAEAGIQPDKSKLNQLVLAIKAIITANAFTQTNNLKEISDAGTKSQTAARGYLGLGKLATKDSLGPADVNALAKDQNLTDVPDKAKARQSLQLGNSATRNVGTTTNTVAAGDDSRIVDTQKAIDDTQTGLAANPVTWINSVNDLSNLPAGARRFAKNAAGQNALPTTDYCYIEVIAKRDMANGGCILAAQYSNPANIWIGIRNTVPVDAVFIWTPLIQTVETLGLKETLNPTKRVCIGSLGAGIFDGRLPSINIGDNDSGFIGSADGVIDIYTNSAKAGYIDSSGLHMLRDIATTGAVRSGTGILTTNGDIYGSAWGNKWLSAWLSSAFASRDININTRATINYVNQTFVRDVRMGANQSGIVWGGGGGTLPAGYVLTGGNFDDAREYPVYAPVQKNINGVWYNVGRQ